MTNARLVITFLGAVLVMSVAGLIWLAHDGVSAPDVLVALPSGALGALSAFLVKSSGDVPLVSTDAPATVTVTEGEPEHRR